MLLEPDNETLTTVTFKVIGADGWYVRCLKDTMGDDPWVALRLDDADYEMTNERFATCSAALTFVRESRMAELRERS